MSELSFARLCDVMRDLGLAGVQRGEYNVQEVLADDTVLLQTWSNDNLYVLVQVSLAMPELGRSLLDVHAGAAYAVTPASELFRQLSTASWRYDYGGVWARVREEGVAYGIRSRLPSTLFHEANLSDSMGFVLGMVDAFGETCNRLFAEFGPLFGGRAIRADDPAAWPPLLGGILPPQ